MSDKTMFGVVLWTNKTDHSAIVWCDDHGDLAFYRANDSLSPESVPLDAGDLIQFSLKQTNTLRFVKDPQLLVRQKMSDLADRLTAHPNSEHPTLGFAHEADVQLHITPRRARA